MNRNELLAETMDNIRTLVNVSEDGGELEETITVSNLTGTQRELLLTILYNLKTGSVNGLGNELVVTIK